MASDMKSKHYTLKKHFVGLPQEDDFGHVEEAITPLADGEFLARALYLSVDPYMRPYSRNMKEGSKMIGGGVGRVVDSKNEEFPKGCLVVGPFGWSTHVVSNQGIIKMFRKIPEIENPSLALGGLGLTGMTAYFGLLNICEPKAGETVFVNAAAGATGSVVGQIAKIKGCRVVGCAGSDAKVEYLKEIGFDGAFNYKTADLEKELKNLCPKGIDCFFDNVGGKMYDTVLKQMNRHGRISLCGCISLYNENTDGFGNTKGENTVHPNSLSPYVHFEAIPKELKIQGFIVTSYYDKGFMDAFTELSQWIKEGKIDAREHVVEGFESMPKAFISLFHGENIGKIVVKV